MKKQNLQRLLCLVMVLGLNLGAGAIDVGWMRQGVRVWYFGGVSGLTTSNAEETYLIKAVSGGNVQLVHHSALDFWNSPKPVDNLIAPVGKGSFWIHPTVLQTLAPGDFWLDQQILTVTWENDTYATFPYHLLPAKALFDLKAQRQIVKITYMINNYSIGRAYFDAETGLVLCRDSMWEGYTMFFILSELNYDFARQTAFAEDGGPHCGFKSFVSEGSLGNGMVGGGSVVIQSGIETRYGNKIEMWVESAFSGPYGLVQAIENYYFDGDIPIVRRINHDQAGNIPPDQWTPFGQYLWWWLPPTATGAPLNAAAGAAAAVQTINVLDVSMTKTADQPLTFAATESPQRFYFSTLWFDNKGYMAEFAAKDPTIGLDIKPGDSAFQNNTTVQGLSYFLGTMGVSIPLGKPTKNDFNRDGQEDILWRHYGSGGQNLVWYMQGVIQKGSGDVLARTDLNWKIVGTGDFNGDARPDILWRYDGPGGKNQVWYMKGTAMVGSASLPAKTDLNWKIVGTGDFNCDGWPDILWRYNGPGGKNMVWYMKGVTLIGTASLPARTDLNWQIVGVGDFNRDGWPDILWRYYGTGGMNAVWYMKRAAWIGGAGIPARTDLNWTIGGVGDFNRDGWPDILWRYYGTGGKNAVWYMKGAAMTGTATLPALTDLNWQIENR
jgi:FG-GAP-like repeat/FG-GAP repeat